MNSYGMENTMLKTPAHCFRGMCAPGRRCSKRLVVLALPLLLIAAPAPAQVSAPTEATITGHTGGFVTGAGVTLNATVTPAAPSSFTAAYQWYRNVAANGGGGTAITGSIGTRAGYTTTATDAGFRLGLGVRYLHMSDNTSSSEIRATPVGVRLAPWSRDNNEIGFTDNDAVAGRTAVLISYRKDSAAFTARLLVQRRLGFEGDNWTGVSTATGNLASIVHTFAQSDIGLYSYRMCALRAAVAPRIFDSEPVCFPVDNGNVASLGAPVRLRVAAAGDGRVRLQWTPPDPSSLIDRYEFRHATGTPTGPWGRTGSLTAAHTEAGLTNGLTYTFEVRAVAMVAVGSLTYAVPGAAASVDASPAVAPGAPTNLKAFASYEAVTLSWDPPATGSPTVYQYRSGDTGCWAAPAAGSTRTVVVRDVFDCTTFQVRAVSGNAPGPAVEVAAALLSSKARPCAYRLRLRTFLEGPLR